MRNFILFLLSIICLHPTFSQDTDIKNVARIMTKNLGTVNDHVYFFSEHFNDEWKYISMLRNEKTFLYKRAISIAEYNKEGFVRNSLVSDLPSFPKGEDVFDVTLNNGKFYILTGNKMNDGFNGQILVYNLSLDQKQAESYKINFKSLPDKYNMHIYSKKDALAVVNTSYLFKNTHVQLESVAIRLSNGEINKSELIILPNQFMNLNDWFMDENQNLKLVYSTEKPEFDIYPEQKDFKNISTLFIEMDGKNPAIKEYDYAANSAYVPTNFRFISVDPSTLLLTAIAIPKSSIEAGYFVSQSSPSAPISFNPSNVMIPKTYKDPKNWSNLEEPRLNKGKCPVYYLKQHLDEAFVSDGKLIFIENSYGYTGDDGLVHEGNFSVATFDLDGFEPVSYFRSENRDCPIQGYCQTSSIPFLYSNNELKCYYLTINYDEIFGVIKKDFGPLNGKNKLIQCTIDLKTGNAKQSYITSVKGTPYMDLGTAYFGENSFNYMVTFKGIDYHNLPKILMESVKF